MQLFKRELYKFLSHKLAFTSHKLVWMLRQLYKSDVQGKNTFTILSLHNSICILAKISFMQSSFYSNSCERIF